MAPQASDIISAVLEVPLRVCIFREPSPLMKPTTYMKAPNGNVRKVEGERLSEDLHRQGWTATDERPAPKAESRKKRGEYVNHTNFSGW